MEVRFNVAMADERGKMRHLFHTEWYSFGHDQIQQELVQAFPAPKYSVHLYERNDVMRLTDITGVAK